MKKNLKVAWIGAGFIGQTVHLNTFSQFKNIKIVALSELREDLGRAVCNKFEIPKFYLDYREMLEQNKVDLVVAIVKRFHTAKVAFNVLDSGNNLFTEKPMAPSFKLASKLLKKAIDYKRYYAIGNMRRFDKGIQEAKKKFNEILNNNQLGKFLYFENFCYAGNDYCNIDGYIKSKFPPPYHHDWARFPEWIKNKKDCLNYEKFLNYFSHNINLIRYFFGDKFQTKPLNISKDNGSILFNFKNFHGFFKYVYTKKNIWKEGMNFYFLNGVINIKIPPAFLINQPAKFKIFNYGKLPQESTYKFDWSWSFKNQASSVIKDVITKSSSISSGKDTINDLKVIESIWKKILN